MFNVNKGLDIGVGASQANKPWTGLVVNTELFILLPEGRAKVFIRKNLVWPGVRSLRLSKNGDAVTPLAEPTFCFSCIQFANVGKGGSPTFIFFPSRDSCNGLWEGDKELINAWTCIIGNKNNYQRWLYRDLRSDWSRVVSLSIYSRREGLLQDYFNLWRLCTRPRAKYGKRRVQYENN